jgi:signal transduction histidine kinase
MTSKTSEVITSHRDTPVAEVRDLVSRFSHDLKGPLGVVLGFSEVLLAELPEGAKHRRDLEDIQQSARDALSLSIRLNAQVERLAER